MAFVKKMTVIEHEVIELDVNEHDVIELFATTILNSYETWDHEKRGVDNMRFSWANSEQEAE